MKSGVTEPNPGTKNRTDLWKQFAQGDIGMINGSPALIPIIQAGGKLTDLRLGLRADRRQVGPARQDARCLRQRLGVQDEQQQAGSNHQVLGLLLPGQVPNPVRQGIRPASGDQLGGSRHWPRIPSFGPFLKALPNSVQYPNAPVWTQVKTQIQQTIATALTQDPKKVLDSIQQTATKGS